MEGYGDILGQLRTLIGDPRQYDPDELSGIISEALATVPDSLVVTVLSGLGDGSSAVPASPMEQAQELDSKYRVRPHITYLNERITQAVKDVEAGKNRMLRISMPPRSGKSRYVSLDLPTWLLRKHPDWKIGMVSYADPLAVSWGRGVRRNIETHPELGIRLAPDLAMAAEWQTTEQGGITSRGINSGYTGVGFKCVRGDTVVESERGPICIEDAYRDGIRRVLAYDHESGRAVWRRVEVASRNRRGGLVVVTTTAGRRLVCTADHRVAVGDGYRPAGDLRPGDSLVAIAMLDPLPVWAGVPHVGGGRTQGWLPGAPAVLLDGVRDGRAGDQPVRTRVPDLRCSNPGEATLLFAGMQAGRPGRGADAPDAAVRVRHGVPAQVESYPVLLPDVREWGTFGTDAWGGELVAHVGVVGAGRVHGDPAVDLRPGRASVRGVQLRGPSGGASPRRGPGEQRSAEPRHPLQDVPLDTPQVHGDTVAAVERLTGDDWVYDLQVEEVHNFFADGMLVHNCLIIDDPVKGTAEAHSKAYRDAQWERWTSDLVSRLEPPYLVCVLGTRWHEDDFIGRVANPEYTKNTDQWEAIEFPAIAESVDVLGRNPGDPLFSPLLDETVEEALQRWSDLKDTTGAYHWAALYQQHPAPSKGTIFDIASFRYWTVNPDRLVKDEDGNVVDESIMLVHPDTDLQSARWLDSWDMAFKGLSTSDWVVGQRWARSGPNRLLLAQKRGKWTFTQTLERVKEWIRQDDDEVSPWGRFVHQRLIEDKANGTAIIDVLHKQVAGIKEMPAKESKESRARAITPEVESGHVYLPHPSDPGNEWVLAAIDEIRDFPHGKNDDVVDALVHALTELRDQGVGMITVPRRRAADARETAASVLTARRSGVTGRARPVVRIPGR